MCMLDIPPYEVIVNMVKFPARSIFWNESPVSVFCNSQR